MVDRETKYYLENITKVKSIDEFVKNDRLFRYAMKAHGLEDMAYAKAFMVKALKEGIADPDSFANKLTDKRYAEFVKTFNFAARGELATVYNKAQHEVPKNYAIQAEIAGVDPNSAFVKDETNLLSRQHRQGEIRRRVHGERPAAHLRPGRLRPRQRDREQGLHPASSWKAAPANRTARPTSRPTSATPPSSPPSISRRMARRRPPTSRAQRPAIDKYMRQTLEENAGEQNEGVRLALYFERKAGGITSFYDVLADPALAKVVRTALGLPDSFASADIDKQVKLFESKLDIEDFSDPEKLGEFLTRFTSLWEIEQPVGAGADVAQRAVQPAGRIRHLDQHAVRHPDDEEMRTVQDGLYVALSAQIALERRLNTIADNVANASTVGFRATGVKFEDVVSGLGDEVGVLRLVRRHLHLQHQRLAARDRQPVRLRHPGRRLVRHRDAGRHGDDPRRPLLDDRHRPAGHDRGLSGARRRRRADPARPAQRRAATPAPTARCGRTASSSARSASTISIRARTSSASAIPASCRRASPSRSSTASMSAWRRASSRSPTSIRCSK